MEHPTIATRVLVVLTLLMVMGCGDGGSTPGVVPGSDSTDSDSTDSGVRSLSAEVTAARGDLEQIQSSLEAGQQQRLTPEQIDQLLEAVERIEERVTTIEQRLDDL